MGKMPPAVMKPQRAGLTLHSLPHEVILSIVEWTAVITIEEHLERQRLAHEAGHMHGDEDDEEEEEEEHDHDHDDGGFPVLGGFQFPPFGMGGFGPNGPNAGQGAAPQATGGIGDVPFMQNLFGFLNNGAGAAGPPNNAAAPPAPPPLSQTNTTSSTTIAASTAANNHAGSTPTSSTVAQTASLQTNQSSEHEDEQEMAFLGSVSQPPTTTYATHAQILSMLMGPDSTPPTPNTAQGPSLPATLSATLAAELHTQQDGGEILTIQDLEDMPDMEAPVASTSAQSGLVDDSEWSTEEESMSNDNGHESDEDDENEDEDEEEDGEHVTDEGHASMSPNSPLASGPVARVTYEDGLPSCPYLPLALVNRSFLNAARTLLYGRHIHLVDIYQAHLLLRTLSEPQVSVHEDEPDADDEAVRQQQSLSYLVRDIAFAMPGLRSLGRGGGSVIIDIIKLCPRLERLSYSSDLTRSAQKPFELALEGCHAMQVIHLRGGDNPAKDLMWEMRNLAPLLSKWKSLKALQVLWLKHSINGPLMPPPSIKLTRLSLAYPDITDSDLVYLLKGSKGTLQQLDLHKPSIKLTRAGVARVVIEHGATLGSLQLDIRKFWHPNEVTAPPAEAAALSEEGAARCRYLMDGLIGHLKVLSELKLSGNLASAMLFARLPKTITILAFEDNIGLDVSKVVTLLAKKKTVKSGKTTKSVPLVAPKLQCFTVARSDGAMLSESLMQKLNKILHQRQACIHWSYHSPVAVWRPEGMPPPPPSALGALGELFGLPGPAGLPFAPDFDMNPFDFPPAMPMMF